jgi:peptidoglycan L-alanyl-D-glutamate endopeptidase CwlK
MTRRFCIILLCLNIIACAPSSYNAHSDATRSRNPNSFKKIYGSSPKEVEKKLVVIYWMPHVFGNRYPLKVTTINGVDKKFSQVSAELEKLPPAYYKYLKNPEGTYSWRNIARTNYLSTHSFGITIDLNRRYSNYWQWDLERAGRPVRESAKLRLRNQIPKQIVSIFEKHGFLWGGSWYHYDTMHFEYRPDVMFA